MDRNSQQTVSIEIPLGAAAPGKYMSQRCDTDLTHSESQICRRIQDDIEASGKACRSPGAVFKYLLALISGGITVNQQLPEAAPESPETRKPGKPEKIPAK